MPEPTIPEYLSYATQNHASDIFIIAGRPLSVKDRRKAFQITANV